MNNKNFNQLKKQLKRAVAGVLLFLLTATQPMLGTVIAFSATTDNQGKIPSVQNNSANQEVDSSSAKRTYEKMVAHGGGTVAGFDTSSSLDAVKQSIDNGFKVIELDMEFSADNQIIMLHDWDRTVETYLGRHFDNKLSESQFNGQLICGKFEPLTFKKLVKILDVYPDVRIITDTKGDNIKLLSTIAQKYPKYINRMIPQIYQYNEYDTVEKLGYKDIILTLYAMQSVDSNQLLAFAKEKDLYAVTIPIDFGVEGLEQKLSKAGIVVYTHPICTIEEAKAQFSKGVYGIYSSTLIPSEIEGMDSTYYLLQEARGKNVKLTDLTITENAVRHIKIKNITGNIGLKYKLDGVILETALAGLENSPFKAHTLTIELWDMNHPSIQQPFYTMCYILTKSGGKVRVLDKKYEYRVLEQKEIPKFEEVITDSKVASLDQETKILLSKCFISKAGEYYYYNNGKSGRFSVGEELVAPQKAINGKVLVPLADTLKLLEGESVFMDSAKYVYINTEEGRILTQINSAYIYKSVSPIRVSAPISIYRGKAMASGEVLEIVTKRNYLDNDTYLIILPKEAKITNLEKEKLLQSVEMLYSNVVILTES